MESIVCQSCEQVIDYYEGEKVSVLYGKCCSECSGGHSEE
ncbi:GapA-binding peptide SR1P [Evansella sp. AB-P1]|nr:GapA-binding peptide SR1P [Evansella sp. AB-P1]MDG5789477.1 GapA-binding peptide SR1P [Evansella sp. AB-P1]